ncbi:MAG: malonic semialdehyde reductase [Betaproteobacteria bacterium]|nr:malonic semialdehyde reductase [Betaproteobacteria bacterium]
MHSPISDAALETLFRGARTHYFWTDTPVDDTLLQRLYELTALPPTAANGQPLRVVFLKSPEAKKRLLPSLFPGNEKKIMAAPVTAILAWDRLFYEHLPLLSPHVDARSWYAGEERASLAEITAFRSGCLQGGYFILAARALGLDCGPISGFDNDTLDREFFPDGRFKSNFLCNLGVGDPAKLFPRAPRLDFATACAVL